MICSLEQAAGDAACWNLGIGFESWNLDQIDNWNGVSAMLNIPTDLLRTLTTVVDLSSFTKAAKALGITQPAVSAQIKRLQSLLGYDLLDKRAPGVILTPRGEFVVNQARRLLSINDDIHRWCPKIRHCPKIGQAAVSVGLVESWNPGVY